VLQGERSLANQNRTLGRFQLAGIAPAPRGVPQIEVTFDIDANGILNVSAKDLGTGKEQKIEIKASSGLSDEEIKRMVRDAEAHAAEDKAQRELIDLRNRADQLAYQTEKDLKEHGEKVDGATRADAERAINAVRDAIKSDDAANIQRAVNELEQMRHRVGEAVYKSAAAAGAQATAGAGVGAGTSKGGKDDVIDAEYEVKE